MPSVSGPQHRLMEFVSHDPAAAKRLGIKQSVGRDFVVADKGRKFAQGGAADDDTSWLFDDKAFDDDTDAGADSDQDGDVTKMAGGGYVKPSTVRIPGHGEVPVEPIPAIERASQNYMKFTGNGPYEPMTRYPEFDEGRAARIAHAYDEMKHDPQDPRVKRAYDAMIEETLGQYRALKDQGLDFRFIKPGEHDPYAASPALGYLDLRDKGMQRVFPTESGFGSLADFDPSTNPLLRGVGRIGDLPNATANDAFRVVHDAYGHFGPGNPFFRHKGEERAWVNHSGMYSPEAIPAMTSETRGQNSWLNFGPFGETNRKASGADTTYADQKTGLMPSWTHEEGFGEGGPVHLPKRRVEFQNNLSELFGYPSKDASQLVRNYADRNGKEALSVGDKYTYSPVVKGSQTHVEFPKVMDDFVADHERRNDPFFSVHSHPLQADELNTRLWPSPGDLRSTLHFAPLQHHMMIEGTTPDARMLVSPSGGRDPLSFSRTMVDNRPMMDGRTSRLYKDFNTANGLDPRDPAITGLLLNDKMASFGLPITIDKAARTNTGLRYEDLLPEAKGYFERNNAMPFAHGGRA